MRISEDAAYRRGLRIGFMTIAIQSLLAKNTLSAGDIERHQNMVADFQFLDLLAELLYHAGELMAKRHSHPSVRDGSIV
jgi:hypothetical protein